MTRNPRKGATTTLEILIVSGLLLFFILAPVAYYNLTVSQMAMLSVFNTTLQAVSVCGGYDSRVEEQLYTNLVARGLIDTVGTANIADIISSDKALPESSRQVIVECNSNQFKGDTPVYRAYSAGSNSGISLRLSVRQTRTQAFLNAIYRMIGSSVGTGDGTFTVTGYTMSQLPKPV